VDSSISRGRTTKNFCSVDNCSRVTHFLHSSNMRILGFLVTSLVGAYDESKISYLREYAELNPDGSRATFGTVYKVADSIHTMGRSDLDSLIRRGVPTVLKNVGEGFNALKELSCDQFAERWPSTPMRAEYTGSPTEVMIPLGNKSSWINNTRSPSGITLPDDCESEDSKDSRPSASPYVLHIKDRVKRSIKQEISRMFPGLPQAKSSDSQTLLDAHTRDSIEFWFQQVGAGTFAHNDGYCVGATPGQKEVEFHVISGDSRFVSRCF